jgi:hypothetical protein
MPRNGLGQFHIRLSTKRGSGQQLWALYSHLDYSDINFPLDKNNRQRRRDTPFPFELSLTSFKFSLTIGKYRVLSLGILLLVRTAPALAPVAHLLSRQQPLQMHEFIIQ